MQQTSCNFYIWFRWTQLLSMLSHKSWNNLKKRWKNTERSQHLLSCRFVAFSFIGSGHIHQRSFANDRRREGWATADRARPGCQGRQEEGGEGRSQRKGSLSAISRTICAEITHGVLCRRTLLAFLSGLFRPRRRWPLMRAQRFQTKKFANWGCSSTRTKRWGTALSVAKDLSWGCSFQGTHEVNVVPTYVRPQTAKVVEVRVTERSGFLMTSWQWEDLRSRRVASLTRGLQLTSLRRRSYNQRNCRRPLFRRLKRRSRQSTRISFLLRRIWKAMMTRINLLHYCAITKAMIVWSDRGRIVTNWHMTYATFGIQGQASFSSFHSNVWTLPCSRKEIARISLSWEITGNCKKLHILV